MVLELNRDSIVYLTNDTNSFRLELMPVDRNLVHLVGPLPFGYRPAF